MGISITFLCWCHASSWHVILPWATEKSQEAGTTFHMLGALHSSYNAQDIYIFFPESLVSRVLMSKISPGSSLLAFCISMVIWNDWKRSRLTTKWCVRAGINRTLWLVSWLKCNHQLSVAQLTPQTKKLKQMQNSNRWKAFWHYWNTFLVMYNHPTPLANPYRILEFEHTNVCAGIQHPHSWMHMPSYRPKMPFSSQNKLTSSHTNITITRRL